MSVVDIVEKEGWGGFCVWEIVVLEVVSVFLIVVVMGGGIIFMDYN